MKYTPHPYQEYATEQIIKLPACGLFLEMGLGKTVSTLTAIKDLMFDYFDVGKVLVIAPLKVAEDTWEREINKWDHLKGLRISKVLGSPASKRINALKADADIYIINRENTKWLVDYYKTKWPFDMVVIDELSSFKSAKSNRFRALRKVRPLIKRMVGLTGTPAPNTYENLWSQLYLLDKGERLEKTLTKYRHLYFSPGQRNGHVVFNWDLREGSKEAIDKKISDICFSMRNKDWLELPERIDRNVPVILSDKAKEQYKELERHLVLEMEDDEITASSAAVLSNKLLQMANGAIYDDEKNVVDVHDEKLKALEEIIESANGQPVLVFYAYRHDKSRIHEYLAKKKIQVRDLETSEDIKNWNGGKIEVLLSHPASSGHGLNLQDGGSIIVWFGLTWSLELYQQANARLYRQGQQNNVIIHHLITDGTIDENVLKALQRKDASQSALMEAVKARIEKVKGEI